LIQALERNFITKMPQFSAPFYIGTARFNNDTYQENIDWKKRKNWEGCGYGFDKTITTKVPQGSWIFIIEMNNSTNHIMGIGLIKNIFIPRHRSRIYQSACWNSCVYKSKYHITTQQILEKKKINHTVIQFLENLLFRGNKHFKRGQGCTIVSYDRISTCESTPHIQYCRKCGLPRKGHKCKRKDRRHIPKLIEDMRKKCRICHLTKKGHICSGVKKNLVLLNIILRFFRELFP